MANRADPNYVIMTSMDLMTRHQPDEFHFALHTRENINSEDLEAKRQSAIQDFKEKILKDTGGSARVNQFIKECVGEPLKEGTDKETEKADNDIETLYSKDQERGCHSPFDLKSHENWFDLPFMAVQRNMQDVLTICFRTGVNISKLFWKDSKNILMYALSLESVQEELVVFLLQHVDVNAEAVNGATALSTCLNNTRLAPGHKLWLVKLLLGTGARIGATGRMHGSPLHTYIYSIASHGAHVDPNWKEIIDELVNASNSIDESDYLGQSSLMIAVSLLPVSVYEAEKAKMGLELQSDSDVSVPTKLEIIEYLLDKGADPNYADSRGNTCLHLAAFSSNISCLRLLQKFGCRANTQNQLGMTVIYSVCAEIGWSNETEDELDLFLFQVLRQLIDTGCNIHSKAMDKSTVLHYAAAKLPSTIVKFLCDLGANVNDTDYLGRTPLHMAARNEDNTGVVQCLVKFQADINATDTHNDTPLHYACLLNNYEAAVELIHLGANVRATGDLGIQPVHLAAENGSSELVSTLVAIVGHSSEDIWGATPLHYAASDGNYETVDVLLDQGADKTLRDSNNMTPLDYALFRGNSLKTAQTLAGDDSRVIFGHLPPLYFPNRPVIKKENVDEYVDGLVDAFRKSGDMGLALANRLLRCPGLGHVDLDKGEAKEISQKIISMMEKIVKRIGELDDMFEATLLRAGSTLEGVKTGFPDEYDFLCNMVKFSSYIERTERSEADGFASVIMREDSPPGILRYCLRSNRVINASYFQKRFMQLARRAMYDVLSECSPQIYSGYMLVTENIPLFDPLFYQKTKLHGQTMTFRGKEHKFLDISVDINPVFFSPVLPKEFIQTCHLLGDISSRGIYLLPKHCAQIIAFPAETVPHSADLWRYSTHHIEAEVMRSIPKLGRECYVMCKLLRMEPMTCGVEFCRYEDKLLTEEQLERLYPGGDATDEDDEGDSELSTDDDVGDDNEIDEEDADEMIAEGAEYTGESDKNEEENTLGKECYDSDDENQETNARRIPSLDNDPNLLFEDEMSAEHAIPSYYLKSIFIKECERLLSEGGTFDEDCLIKIPWRVYKQLQKACDEKKLTTLFLPSQNMFQRAITSSDDFEAETMRKMYCRNIIRVMENLELKEKRAL